METSTEIKPRTPGIVIFTAVLNFITASMFAFLTLICLVIIGFGNIMGIYERVSEEVSRYPSTSQVGVTFLFGVSAAIGFAFAVLFVAIGVGLLKGKKLAWFFQVALSVLSLLAFPFGTVLNGIILVFFFQKPVRDYFKV
jgi:hypothetical protein